MLPVWYKAAKPLIDAGELAMLGVVQEQHAERARLYKQWKQYDFPIVQDASTQLNLWAVPIPLLIDEYGIVRNSKPKPSQLAKFVDSEFEAAQSKPDTQSTNQSDSEEWIYKGNIVLHAKKLDPNKAVDTFKKAVEADAKNAKALFSLGVAYRMRFDGESRQEGDFQNAYECWKKALQINPNQYIWRRRIEQYGPRLTKPYPFYDWVETAIKDIKSRGDTPVSLTVPLTGTEVASAIRQNIQETTIENPDPEANIFADESNFLKLSATVVPNLFSKKSMLRVHLDLDIQKAKWNKEGGPIKIWIDESSDGTPEKRLLEIAADLDDKTEIATKTIDFEFQPRNSKAGKLSGYVLFHCCDNDGVCYYYRKEFQIPFRR